MAKKQNVQKERKRAVNEALSWLGTPYHHMGRVKGAGVDCGMLLAEVFERAGLVEHIEVDYYSSDWHLHHEEEIYLSIVERFAHKVDREPLPGDIVLYKFGRCVSHGAIVVEWPTVIHSYLQMGVILGDGLQEPLNQRRFFGVYSIWD
jgi:cell wall-associated NlpC family hydrolase